MEVIQQSNFYDEYKTIIQFMKGIQVAELMGESDQKVNVTRTDTDTHFVYHFIMPREEEKYSWDNEKHKYNMTFGIYCHKEKFQVVMKSGMLYSGSVGTGHMLTNNLTSTLMKLGFKNIKYDIKKVRGSMHYPLIFVKVLLTSNDYLTDIHTLYETMKDYNNKWHAQWMEKYKW